MNFMFFSPRLIFCCGQGAWEERMLVEARALEQVLREKSIPAWVDCWGAMSAMGDMTFTLDGDRISSLVIA